MKSFVLNFFLCFCVFSAALGGSDEEKPNNREHSIAKWMNDNIEIVLEKPSNNATPFSYQDSENEMQALLQHEGTNISEQQKELNKYKKKDQATIEIENKERELIHKMFQEHVNDFKKSDFWKIIGLLSTKVLQEKDLEQLEKHILNNERENEEVDDLCEDIFNIIQKPLNKGKAEPPDNSSVKKIKEYIKNKKNLLDIEDFFCLTIANGLFKYREEFYVGRFAFFCCGLANYLKTQDILNNERLKPKEIEKLPSFFFNVMEFCENKGKDIEKDYEKFIKHVDG